MGALANHHVVEVLPLPAQGVGREPNGSGPIRLVGRMNGDGDIELAGFCVERIVVRVSVGFLRVGKGREEGTAASVVDGAFEFVSCGPGIGQ